MKEQLAGKGILDSEELLHLAMAAINAGQHPQAMAMLKQARKLDPENGWITYLLAAEHAQVGMFARAIDGMAEALGQNSEIHVAALQLGLLYTAQDRTADARPLFQRLADLPAEDSLHWFGEGLVALLDDDVDGCRVKLEHGMSLNRTNPALNRDIGQILLQLGDGRDATGEPAPHEASPASAAANNLFLSRYGKGESE